jgi:hypothetical protein
MNSSIYMFVLLLLDLAPAELGALRLTVWQIKDPGQLHAPSRERLLRFGFYTLIPKTELPGDAMLWARTEIGERAARALGMPGPD